MLDRMDVFLKFLKCSGIRQYFSFPFIRKISWPEAIYVIFVLILISVLKMPQRIS